MNAIEIKIKELFERGGSHYLTAKKNNEETMIIRISDHIGNIINNNNKETVSLISELKYYGHNRMNDEFVVSEYEDKLYIDDLMSDLTTILKNWGIVSINCYNTIITL